MSMTAKEADTGHYYLVRGRRLTARGICGEGPFAGKYAFSSDRVAYFAEPDEIVEEFCCYASRARGLHPVGLKAVSPSEASGSCDNCGQRWAVSLPRERDTYRKIHD